MTIYGFWLKPPDYGRSRELDPLALSTLHDAAADVLLPILSGRTRSAEDFIWVLVGLRWANEQAPTEIEIWDHFEIFEKALKLTWFHQGRVTGYSGRDAIRDHYNAGRTDLSFKLISNQRYQGLLGAYLRALRAGALVHGRSLRLTEVGKMLINKIRFQWKGTVSGYGWLARTFERAKMGFTRSVYRELGAALFDPPAMCDVARTIRALGARPNWRSAARRLTISNGKRPVALIGNDLGHFLKQVTATFWSILEKPTRAVPRLEAGPLRARGWRDIIFRSERLQALHNPIESFLADAGRHPRRALIELHAAVWKQRGHPVPWVRASKGKIIVRTDIGLKTPPAEAEWDLRWVVAHKLIRQTAWRPK